jgi:uncharacterized protein YlbG (UPF0298 family)
MILSLRPKKLCPKAPRQHKQLQQGGRIQNHLQKSLVFLYTNNEQIENKYVETIPLIKASKKHIPRSKLNKGCE